MKISYSFFNKAVDLLKLDYKVKPTQSDGAEVIYQGKVIATLDKGEVDELASIVKQLRPS